MEIDLSLDSNPEYAIEEIQFRSYTTSEVKALSVKEVTNPEAFDTLQQPSFGGLYDPAFGPSDNYDGCQTCGQGKAHCPGHMGHIELPLPAYNPVLFQSMYRILKSTCFECHRVVVNPEATALFIQQCRLLDFGEIAGCCELEEQYGQLMRQKQKTENVVKKEVLEEAVANFLEGRTEADLVHVKNIEAVRQKLISSFLREEMKPNSKCWHCKVRLRSLRHENRAKLILLVRPKKEPKKSKTSSKKGKGKGGKNAKKKKVADVDSDDDMRDDEASEDNDNDATESTTPGKRKRPPVEDMEIKAVKVGVTQLTPLMVRSHLHCVWVEDSVLLKRLFPTLAITPGKNPMDIFFWDIIPVPPSRYRPMVQLREKSFENPQTHNLSKVLRNCVYIREILWEMDKASNKTQPTEEEEPMETTKEASESLVQKLNSALISLQVGVNVLVDSNSDTRAQKKDGNTGIKQLLEKKAGLLRMNMMGKRVNFAARSVISPDPNINTFEIGIPEVFATSLTYPQPVTPWNVHELREAVMNGPNKHPGAIQVINEDGTTVLLDQKNATQREAVAKRLLTPTTVHGKPLMGSKKVLRHLKNGDVLLINRQPTLHKPSIQAHSARVLPGEKTLRLHYANCKAYNADFDGDEMNAHFPQNELGRSEAYNIVSTDHQYLVPKDGTPLAGLIQDHMVSGVSLTIRGRMFNKSDYCRLVYTALVDKGGPIHLLPPCVLKPYRLWSGKQVLSTVVLNVLPADKPALSLTGKSKVPEKSWIKVQPRSFSVEPTEHMGESDVIIRHGELLVGILDKGHYGPTPYGLVHCCYELYGGSVAGKILTCFGRLFLNFLQWKGFTLGVEDILVKPKADDKRTKFIQNSPKAGLVAVKKALNLGPKTDRAAVLAAYKTAHFNLDQSQMREVDMAMRNETNQIQNDIANTCMPKGLHKLFPDNNLQLMVVSGAKGSSVNCMQISCLLGQIELEGKRPPLMLSGRTLPSFLEYDVTPRAGGFVTGRFLTGIRQQEYFFHCMAGREGLVDTAVKTSRSGYLQRCLVKHLEGIKVNYDLTVRDSDDSVVQFYYGEDSLDVCKTGFLTPKQFPFLVENHKILSCKEPLPRINKAVGKLDKKIKKWYKKFGKTMTDGGKVRRSAFLMFCEDVRKSKPADYAKHEQSSAEDKRIFLSRVWAEQKPKLKQSYTKATARCPDPVISQYSPYTRDALPEKTGMMIQKYAKKDLKLASTEMSDDLFLELMDRKLKRTIVEPGEAVGLLCAQSIGEPSTQMTLNTFHFAGRNEMNVTLGIPRLREILMVGSRNLNTPAMDIPIEPGSAARDKAKQLQKQFTKVHLNEVLKDVKVEEWMAIKGMRKLLRKRMFSVTFTFLPEYSYRDRFSLSPDQIIRFIEKVYIKRLVQLIRYKIRKYARSKLLSHGTTRNSEMGEGKEKKKDDEEADEMVDAAEPSAEPTVTMEDDDSDIGDADDGDNVTDKQKKRHTDEHDYDDEMDEEDDEDKEKTNPHDDDDVVMDGELSEHEEGEEGAMDESEGIQKKGNNRSARVNAVLQCAPEVEEYKYDMQKKLWCEVLLSFPLPDSKLDLLTLIEENVKKVVVHEVENIARCFINEEKTPGGGVTEPHLKTEGINIQELHKHVEVLQVNRLYSNDIHRMAEYYGIEAASRVIIKEIQAVFAAYGIVVNYRHLSLLAEYMTFEGIYKPFNRRAMESNPSPLQKMSFETTMTFLVDASIKNSMDKLKSPSAQIVVGKNVTCGTGCIDLFTPLVVS